MSGIEIKLGEIAQHTSAMARAAEQSAIERAREMERLRGETNVRLPLLIATGANPFTLGGDVGTEPLQTPEEGYVWSLRHLVIEGLTTGATPDVVNILRGGRIIWQLNGNQFCQTWGRGEMVIKGGEALAYQSVGTFNATGKIVIHGSAYQVPGPMIGKFF